jgi:hypothetical protein
MTRDSTRSIADTIISGVRVMLAITVELSIDQGNQARTTLQRQPFPQLDWTSFILTQELQIHNIHLDQNSAI